METRFPSESKLSLTLRLIVELENNPSWRCAMAILLVRHVDLCQLDVFSRRQAKSHFSSLLSVDGNSTNSAPGAAFVASMLPFCLADRTT